MDMFPPKIISTGVLLIHQVPVLTPFDFYLWGNLKHRVYKTNTHMEEELKENI
jgi:hypothetical protein